MDYSFYTRFLLVYRKYVCWTNKSYALDKTKLFEYSIDDDKHVYGSYDGLMDLADTKGKLIYDFDLKSKGSMSIRFKPVVSSLEDRTIIMHKKDGINLFGVKLNTDNKLCVVLNGTDYVFETTTYAYDEWQTVVLTWNELLDPDPTFKVYNGVTTKELTASLSLKDAMTIIESDLSADGFTPEKHLNGQLEMLAYKDDVIDAATVTKLFQNNHVLSVKTYVDILGRSKKDVIDTGLVELENSYSYKAPASEKSSLQVESIQKYDNTTVTYGYDELGNITSMVIPGDADGIVDTYEYEYDYLNRLVREYNPKLQKTMIMVYKTNNNIEFKKYYNGNQPLTVTSTPIESYEYKYENSWKDQLTSVVKSLNGVVDSTETISYTGSNFIGNPSSIGDKNLTWSGRRLTKITEANKDTIEYFYNEEGMRTKKIVGTDITTYELNGSNIISETIVDSELENSEKTINYIYNERGLLVGFEHLSKVYYYVRDLLGIITEVVDENGSVMVSYKYDAWGKITHKTVNNSSIDSVNHFVYKGYYLDNETQWYYLETRYYDCHASRYINSDYYEGIDLNIIGGANLFSYCGNNPVSNIDEDGKSWWKKTLMIVGSVVMIAAGVALIATGAGAIAGGALIGAGIGSIAGGIINSANGGSFEEGWLIGGISGAIVGAGIAYLLPAITSFAASSFTFTLGQSAVLGGNAMVLGGGISLTITGAEVIAGTLGVAGALGAYMFASNHRPGNNRAQNKQIRDALRSEGVDPKSSYGRDLLNEIHKYIRKYKLDLGWEALKELIRQFL